MDTPKVIHIHGRKWFEKVNGNTYHSVTVWVDGEQVHRTDFEYGYGSQYLWTATVALKNEGFLPGIKGHEKGGHLESLWRYCERKGIKFVDEVTDVQRKKDL